MDGLVSVSLCWPWMGSCLYLCADHGWARACISVLTMDGLVSVSLCWPWMSSCLPEVSLGKLWCWWSWIFSQAGALDEVVPRCQSLLFLLCIGLKLNMWTCDTWLLNMFAWKTAFVGCVDLHSVWRWTCHHWSVSAVSFATFCLVQLHITYARYWCIPVSISSLVYPCQQQSDK